MEKEYIGNYSSNSLKNLRDRLIMGILGIAFFVTFIIGVDEAKWFKVGTIVYWNAQTLFVTVHFTLLSKIRQTVIKIVESRTWLKILLEKMQGETLFSECKEQKLFALTINYFRMLKISKYLQI